VTAASGISRSELGLGPAEPGLRLRAELGGSVFRVGVNERIMISAMSIDSEAASSSSIPQAASPASQPEPAAAEMISHWHVPAAWHRVPDAFKLLRLAAEASDPPPGRAVHPTADPPAGPPRLRLPGSLHADSDDSDAHRLRST
jgi:hypothetical protein